MCDPKKRKTNTFDETNFLEDEMVASSNDLTGLVQKPPSDESEMESYAELHHVPVPDDIPERKR